MGRHVDRVVRTRLARSAAFTAAAVMGAVAAASGGVQYASPSAPGRTILEWALTAPDGVLMAVPIPPFSSPVARPAPVIVSQGSGSQSPGATNASTTRTPGPPQETTSPATTPPTATPTPPHDTLAGGPSSGGGRPGSGGSTVAEVALWQGPGRGDGWDKDDSHTSWPWWHRPAAHHPWAPTKSGCSGAKGPSKKSAWGSSPKGAHSESSSHSSHQVKPRPRDARA